VTRILRLAWRLWRSNPRVFYHRLHLVLRSPLRTATRLIEGQRRERRLNAAYGRWLSECQAKPPPIPADGPLLSVVMPVHDVDLALLEEAIDSVLVQTYPHWELCLADDASSRSGIRSTLARYAAADARIHVAYRDLSGHIAAASNTALGLAGGEFILLLDHDDCLAPEALAAVAGTVTAHPEVDLIYSDEDKLAPDGRHIEPFFKPSWSPTLFTATNYLNHLVALRRSLVLDVGGFRNEMIGSQDYDLLLRVEERARAVAHIPRVLYSWRMAPGSTARGSAAKPYAVAAARRALIEAVARRGIAATVTGSHLNGPLVLRRHLPPPYHISLVVLGDGTAWQSVHGAAGVEVRDAVLLGATQEGLTSLPKEIRQVEAVEDLTGEWLVVLDAVQRPLDADTLRSLLEPLQDETVAMAGGCTLSRDGLILQAGVAIGLGGQPTYLFAGLPALPLRPFFLNFKDLMREVAAVAVGCCALRHDTWRALGGWRPDLPPPLAMTDLCLHALSKGQRNVYTPLAQFERSTSLPSFPPIPTATWRWRETDDLFWSPFLTAEASDGLPFRCPDDRQPQVRPARVG